MPSRKGEDKAHSRRRRAPAAVTLVACTECRRKRAKCDGKRPCSRCAAREEDECVYDVHLRTSKETMKVEIDRLRSHCRITDRIFEALTMDEHFHAIRRQLKQNVDLEDIANGIGSMPSGSKQSRLDDEYLQEVGADEDENEDDESQKEDDDVAECDGDHAAPERDNSVVHPVTDNGKARGGINRNAKVQDPNIHHSTKQHRNDTVMLVVGHESLSSTSSKTPGSVTQASPAASSNACIQPWTTITNDVDLIDHLLALYFCWEYPTFASLSKAHFYVDMRNGRPRYCSALLVNALLSLGCRFSDHPEAISAREHNGTAGDQFFAECERLLGIEDDMSLSTIQALGLMALREASCGHDGLSTSYARRSMEMAINMELYKDPPESKSADYDPDDQEVRSATFWGCLNLEIAWSLCIGRLPQLRRNSVRMQKPAIVSETEEEEWIPATNDGKPLMRDCRQPSNIRAVYKAFSELSEIIHDSLFVVYNEERRLTSPEVLHSYHRYLDWYSRLPDALRLGENFTPSVLFTHMYYHFAILLLFRPFLNLVFLSSAVSPREICTQAAENISSIMRSYHSLYTLRYTPSFVPYIVLTSGIMHLLNSNTALGSAYSVKTLDDLKEMTMCHGFAARSVTILQSLAKHWHIDITLESRDVNMSNGMAHSMQHVAAPPPPPVEFFNIKTDDEVPESDKDRGGSSLCPLFSVFEGQALPSMGAVADGSRSTGIDSDTQRALQDYIAQTGFSIPTSRDSNPSEESSKCAEGHELGYNDHMWVD